MLSTDCVRVTILATPVTASSVQHAVDSAARPGHPLGLMLLPGPPEGSCNQVTNPCCCPQRAGRECSPVATAPCESLSGASSGLHGVRRTCPLRGRQRPGGQSAHGACLQCRGATYSPCVPMAPAAATHGSMASTIASSPPSPATSSYSVPSCCLLQPSAPEAAAAIIDNTMESEASSDVRRCDASWRWTSSSTAGMPYGPTEDSLARRSHLPLWRPRQPPTGPPPTWLHEKEPGSRLRLSPALMGNMVVMLETTAALSSGSWGPPPASAL